MGYEWEDNDAFDLAVALGRVTGLSGINKYGRAPAGVQLTATDIWDLADAVPTQQVWLAPTAASIHQIASTSGLDTLLGAGARTVRIFGLTDWDTSEVSEDIEMAGAVDVPTTRPYVIIHRMQVLDWRASGPNAGTITATADVGGTVTAAILPGNGQTQMAIYGVPRGEAVALCDYYADILRAGGATNIFMDVALLVNPIPDVVTTGFIEKHKGARVGSGTSSAPHEFCPPVVYEGPCIVKIQCISSAADTGASAGFDGKIVDT